MITRRSLLVLSVAAIASACTRSAQIDPPGLYARPERNEWPAELRELPEDTQAMYRYAVANRDVLQYMPCFCGCGAGGHGSNYDCYVDAVLPDGRVRLDTMSFG